MILTAEWNSLMDEPVVHRHFRKPEFWRVELKVRHDSEQVEETLTPSGRLKLTELLPVALESAEELQQEYGPNATYSLKVFRLPRKKKRGSMAV